MSMLEVDVLISFRLLSSGLPSRFPLPRLRNRGAQGERELEAPLGVGELVAEKLVQAGKAVANRLRMHVQLGGDLGDLALVIEPGAQRPRQPLARGPSLAVERRQPARGEIPEDQLVPVRDQGAEVIVGEREAPRPDRP